MEKKQRLKKTNKGLIKKVLDASYTLEKKEPSRTNLWHLQKLREAIKELIIDTDVDLFTSDQVVKKLEDEETMDDAIQFFKTR